MIEQYREFLKAKCRMAEDCGVGVSAENVHPLLKRHQRDTVLWNVQGGRRADFLSFGLGKTFIQLETCRILAAAVNGRALIVAPLGVRQEFMRDAAKLGIELRFIRRIEEASETGLYITNYETVRDGKLDPRHFDVASLDEASVLRGFGGSKTFREFMRLFEGVAYRFVATATPSPNDYIEILAYAAFLGIMDVGEAKTRFFKRDSTKADVLTLHPHKEREFWLWVSSWALFLQKPSDLGYSDEGYALPEMKVVYHEVAVDHSKAQVEKSGQSTIFREATKGVVDASREKRDTLELRVAKMRKILAAAPEDHFLLWHDLEAERRAIEDALPEASYGDWDEYADGHPVALEMYERHYSSRKLGDERKLAVGPGEKMVLLHSDGSALFVWRKFIDDSGQTGVNCAVFRNEGWHLSSALIIQAVGAAWQRWPGERLYTTVDPDEVLSSNPGWCFQQAGWRPCGYTKGGLRVLEYLPVDAGSLIFPKRLSRRTSVYGTQNLEEREQAIIDFSDGKIQYLAAKPVIAGSGCNFQRHCRKAIFVGIGFKFNDFIQAIHRIHRFLQPGEVEIHIIHAESERLVLRTLLEKWEKHKEMVAKMGEIIREFGLAKEAMAAVLTRSLGVERVEVHGENWSAVNNDTVEETAGMSDSSVHLILTSIPFSTQYEYTPSYNDFGHTDDNEHFFQQMDFLTPNLLRILVPGRVAAIHVKDRVVPSGMTGLGMQTVYPFHARCIEHYTRHGFAYMGMKTIVTDVVRENNQTYRLGWSEQCKDGTKHGCGMPEYLLLFRKPPTDRSNGYGDIPVVKSKEKYTRARWQVDAHGFARSSGNRLMDPDELRQLDHDVIFKLFRDYTLNEVYDFEQHVKIGETIAEHGRLPSDFMLLQPASSHPDVWTDVTRMLTLNGAQSAKGREMHLCPMQFDVADRVIAQMSMPGETVFDPFGGLMTVPYRAVLAGRRGVGVELNARYFLDGCSYLAAAERKKSMPSLFDTLEGEAA